MSGCLENPVWPCAMTGACAVLSGFRGLAVVIHGSSGCYYYPRSLLKVPLFSTYLLESEIVFGTVDRLHEVVASLEAAGRPVAVVNTCVPALTGEDLARAFDGTHAVFVDAPGFLGNAGRGAEAAYAALDISVSKTDGERVNIDGVCGLDLFARGNLHEAQRILSMMKVPAGLSFAADEYAQLKNGAGGFSVSVNPSWNAKTGEMLGSLLFPDLKDTVAKIEERFAYAESDALYAAWEHADELMFYYSDKYLRKYSPPTAVIAAQQSYCDFSREMLVRYFGLDVPVCMPREQVTDFTQISEAVAAAEPDIVIGSTFEAGVCPKAAFFGITPPDRSRISMAARPAAGIEGGIMFMESVLNALLDAHKNKK